MGLPIGSRVYHTTCTLKACGKRCNCLTASRTDFLLFIANLFDIFEVPRYLKGIMDIFISHSLQQIDLTRQASLAAMQCCPVTTLNSNRSIFLIITFPVTEEHLRVPEAEMLTAYFSNGTTKSCVVISNDDKVEVVF